MSDFGNFDEHENGRDSTRATRQAEIRLPIWKEKLGWLDIMCLVLNRTIGSGIFVTPTFVLRGTGNVGASLLLWAAGAILSTCGLLLEWVMKKPKFLATCLYGIVFIILGNLSGNAIAFGVYVMRAAGNGDPSRKTVIPIAIGVLTLAVLVHVFSRRGAIKLNNYFAFIKVSFLLAIIILGFMNAGGVKLSHQDSSNMNFNTTANPLNFTSEDWRSNLKFRSSFTMPVVSGDAGNARNPGSYIDAFSYILYTFSGFEQPFYVLAEVRKPRKTFPWSTLTAILIAAVLFMLVNIAYMCVVPASAQLQLTDDMATLFFRGIFGHENIAAQQAMSAMIAMSIFSNILVMTFTASRVKQEIAKEGILPFSLTIANGSQTLDSWIRNTIRSLATNSDYDPAISADLEQSPMAALFLHWVSSVFLVAITSFLRPRLCYGFLTGLYSYVIIIYMGFWVSLGLLITRLRDREWKNYAAFQPWLAPAPACIYCTGCLFLLVGAFWPPSAGSPFTYANTHYQWYLIPTIGLSTVVWGLIWWLGLKLVMILKGSELYVRREPLPVQDEEDETQWVLKSEIVSQEWHTGAELLPFRRRKGGRIGAKEEMEFEDWTR